MYLRKCKWGAAHLVRSLPLAPHSAKTQLSSFLGAPACPPWLSRVPYSSLGTRPCSTGAMLLFSCSWDKLGLIPQLWAIFTCCSRCLESPLPHVHRLSLTPFSSFPRCHLLREPFSAHPTSSCSGPTPRLLFFAAASPRGPRLTGEGLVLTTEKVPWDTAWAPGQCLCSEQRGWGSCSGVQSCEDWWNPAQRDEWL